MADSMLERNPAALVGNRAEIPVPHTVAMLRNQVVTPVPRTVATVVLALVLVELACLDRWVVENQVVMAENRGVGNQVVTPVPRTVATVVLEIGRASCRERV